MSNCPTIYPFAAIGLFILSLIITIFLGLSRSAMSRDGAAGKAVSIDLGMWMFLSLIASSLNTLICLVLLGFGLFTTYGSTE